MILVFKHGTSEKVVHNVEAMLTEEGCRVFINEHNNQFQIVLLGASDLLNKIKKLPEIEAIRESHRTLKLTSREFHPQDSIIEIGDVVIGGDQPVIMAGPCSVESEDQILNVASFLKGLGVQVLRGGAFKPRTSPYSFQGLQERGLQLLNKARHQTGMLVISEVMDASQIPMMQEYVDILQVGSRNMQNYYLLKELGKIDKPVMLKRGGSSTIDEWLLAAEYIMAEGNTQVILCERGIRSIESYTRNTLDLNAVPVVKDISHLPVIVDPSHGVGVPKYIPSMAKAALAAGADGIIMEVHPDPENALSDGEQSLNFQEFRKALEDIQMSVKVKAAVL